MSFAGTVAWMAPEVIRNEPCSEKVDIWSFGVVLWELLTCEVPYKDIDSSAIIWGVGNNTLSLPIPKGCPQGFQFLVNLCWSLKPRNRPSFKTILHHLELIASDLLDQPHINEKEFFELQNTWREEILEKMMSIKQNSVNIQQYENKLIKKREHEWHHAQEIRKIYEDRLSMTNILFSELKIREQQLFKDESQQSSKNLFSIRKRCTSHPQLRKNYFFDVPSVIDNVAYQAGQPNLKSNQQKNVVKISNFLNTHPSSVELLHTNSNKSLIHHKKTFVSTSTQTRMDTKYKKKLTKSSKNKRINDFKIDKSLNGTYVQTAKITCFKVNAMQNSFSENDSEGNTSSAMDINSTRFLLDQITNNNLQDWHFKLDKNEN